MFEIILFLAYYLLTLFYGFFGVAFLTPSTLGDRYLSPFFPLLAALKLNRLKNALSLLFIALVLAIVGTLIAIGNSAGLFWALVLSAWEVYLSIRFYYYEMKDIPQTLIHFVLHAALVIAIGSVILYP